MSIRSFFEENLTRNPSRNIFLYNQNGQTVSRTYGEAGVRVRQISELVISGLEMKPRADTAAIILENGPLWIEIYLGLNSVALPVVPIDPKLRPEEVEYIADDAKVSLIFSDCHHIKELTEIAPKLPGIKAFVFTDGKAHGAPSSIDGRPCYDLEEMMTEFADKAAADKCAFNEIAVSDDDIASVIYTSGTTGHPKGAMMSNGNFCFDADAALEMFKNINVGSHDDFFVVLPLFHSFSFNTNFVVPMRVGAGIQFAGSLRTIGEDMKKFKPSIIMGVPLLVEKMHSKIEDGIRKNKVAKFLKKIGLNALVVKGIRKNFGGRLRLFIVGGAPCAAKLLDAMRALGMPIIEGYGLTEASPIVSIRPYYDTHVGTIGIPIPGIEVKLADINSNGVGELLVRGPIVMKGYLNKPAETAEALDSDGWLHTGDLASQDADGFLTIRGRKKALIVNREGKNIYPEEVELCIGRDKHILEVLVVGYSEHNEVGEKVGAIIVPNLDLYTSENGGNEPEWEKIEASVRHIVASQCAHLAEYKTPRKLVVRRELMERTSAGKIRRFTYRDALNS